MSKTTENKPLPHDIDAEEATLGSVLLDGNTVRFIDLKPEDFYSERNGWVWSAILALKDRQSAINAITVAQELNKLNKLEECGGAAYLAYLPTTTPTSLDAKYYADIVRYNSVKRQIIAAGKRVIEVGYGNGEASELVAQANEITLSLASVGNKNELITPRLRRTLVAERYNDLYEKEGGIAISTGLHRLDEMLGGGFFAGEFIVIGARPSMGKTELMRFMANHAGKKHNVLFCSGEMNVEDVTDRDVAGELGIPLSTVRQGGYDSDTYCELLRAVEVVTNLNVYYYDKAPMTTANIMQVAHSMKLQHGLDIIFVDYMSFIDDAVGESQNARVAYISKRLKTLGKTLKVPVVVASQLSRGVENREDKRPILSDLRDSGSIEQDADVVMFLYRDAYYYKRSEWEQSESKRGTPYPEDITEIIIAKQRQGGRVQGVRVKYDRKYHLYRDENWMPQSPKQVALI